MLQVFINFKLRIAVKKNNLSNVKKLLSNGANINIKDNKRRSLLTLAYHFNSDNVIDFLRDNGVRQEINRLYSYARKCFNNNNLLEAKKRFEELKNHLPKDSVVYYYLGSIDYKLGLEENEIIGVNPKLVESVESLKIALNLHEADLRLNESKLANITMIMNEYHSLS